MGKSKSRKGGTSQAQKAGLKKLRERGLYTPKNPRKRPTKYALSLLRKFSDVLSGNARVLRVDPADAKYFDNAGSPGMVRRRKRRVIVPVQDGETVSYSRKKHEVRVSRRLETGERYVRVPFRGKVRSFDDAKDQLRPNDRIAVAYYRGKGKAPEYHYFSLDEFYNTFVGGYAKAATEARREAALKWALDHAMISRFEGAAQDDENDDED